MDRDQEWQHTVLEWLEAMHRDLTTIRRVIVAVVALWLMSVVVWIVYWIARSA